MTLTPNVLRADVARAFGVGAEQESPRLGLEVEAIPVDTRTSQPARIARTLAALASLNWESPANITPNMTGLRRSDGAKVTFEPGGQIEYSSQPHATGSALLADVDGAFAQINSALSAAGLALHMVGLDPVTPIEQVPLQLDAPRYRRMDAHFASIGPWGRRMMRQTAAIQLSIDPGSAPFERWRLLATLAPVVAAMFANSPADSGTATGERSIRRRIWAALDPLRTGLPALGDDPIGEYMDFALKAPAFLLGHDPSRAEPFSAWISRGATIDDWHAHLSTLFPEVRPRGYFEFRVADANEGDAMAALVALVAGIAWHPASTAAAIRQLPRPTAERMARAGCLGLADPELAAAARTAVDLALAGCEALGSSLLNARDLERANRFFDRDACADRHP